MIKIVLFEPEIPQNTGNIIRLAANAAAQLHLIRPLGFDLEDKKLRRAGLDYHEFAGIVIHENWLEFRESQRENRLFGVSIRGATPYHQVNFEAQDCVIFGPETRGLPETIREELGAEKLLRIPMAPDSRSLNLANAAAIVVYEAWRQLDFAAGQ